MGNGILGKNEKFGEGGHFINVVGIMLKGMSSALRPSRNGARQICHWRKLLKGQLKML